MRDSEKPPSTALRMAPDSIIPTVLSRSRTFSPDPLPDLPTVAQTDRVWIYRRADFELAVLNRVVSSGFAANDFVHYADNYGRPESIVDFVSIFAEDGRLHVYSPNERQAWTDGSPVPCSAAAKDGWSVIEVVAGAEIRIRVFAPPSEPATFALLKKAIGASSPWMARGEHQDEWQATLPREGDARPPHLREQPTTLLPLQESDGLLRVAAPVLGRIELRSGARPSIRSGESAAEARSSDAPESRHGVHRIAADVWGSDHDLGLKYLRVTGAEAGSALVRAVTPLVPHRGGFVCSDDRLSAIWGISAYTLRLCMQGVFVDGIKRDRMPWAGDQALNTLANAYAFGHRDITRDSIVALGQPTHGYVNGISDYSLWWLINVDFYLRYFGDHDHVQREAASIHAFVERLAQHADEDGLFRPADQPDGFVDASAGSVFIDWGVHIAVDGDYVPLQILWYWALTSAARALRIAPHPGADRWGALANRVRDALRRTGWSHADGAWREYRGGPVSAEPHAHAFGVLSGLTPTEFYPDAEGFLRSEARAGTPFMSSVALRAMTIAGAPGEVVRRVRSLWGEMVDAGAQTFWEEFAEPNSSPFEMYGRPFGKSLCHAWSSGPAALLPEAILGLRPTLDGWQAFSVDPDLGELDWAAAVVPTPFGEIGVEANRECTIVKIPAGASARINGVAYRGGQTVSVRVEADASIRG